MGVVADAIVKGVAEDLSKDGGAWRQLTPTQIARRILGPILDTAREEMAIRAEGRLIPSFSGPAFASQAIKEANARAASTGQPLRCQALVARLIVESDWLEVTYTPDGENHTERKWTELQELRSRVMEEKAKHARAEALDKGGDDREVFLAEVEACLAAACDLDTQEKYVAEYGEREYVRRQIGQLRNVLRREPWAYRPRQRCGRPNRTVLYRHFDRNDVLLYVGISYAPAERTKAHAAYAEWTPYAVRMEAEWFDTRAEAEAAETQAIRAEGPLFNREHAPEGTAERRTTYLADSKRTPDGSDAA